MARRMKATITKIESVVTSSGNSGQIVVTLSDRKRRKVYLK
jgi:hypothetical protein